MGESTGGPGGTSTTLAVPPCFFAIAATAGRQRLGHFLAGIAPVQAVAASPQSSLATLPAMLESSDRRLGFPPSVSGLVLLPSTVGPAGFTQSGLPLGYQAIAGHGHDRTALLFSRLVEREFGGFVAPPGYE